MAEGYEKLEIYQRAHDLAVRVHKMTLTLPRFEMHEEGGQVRRSSKSISSNIVEGFALRKYKNEFLHYLYRTFGSSKETIEHLKYLSETESWKDKDMCGAMVREYEILTGMIFRFIESVEGGHEKPSYLKEPEGEYDLE